jgi:Bacterial-like globin
MNRTSTRFAPSRNGDVLRRLGTVALLSKTAEPAIYSRSMPTLFEHAGGEEALHRLEQIFYDSVLADPILQPLFGNGRATHVDHLTAFTAESFGAPDRFSRENSHAQSDAELHPPREVPRWTWPGDDAGS